MDEANAVIDPFAPYQLGPIQLANRIVMAPMTRSRATTPTTVPGDLLATYYAQRATAGLIITEGVQPSVVGQGYPDTPGLHSAEQVAGWRRVTDAVHAKGGVIFAQLMHAGRICDPQLLPDGLWPVAPSALPADGELYTHAGPKPHPVPVALDEAGIERTIADFVTAASNALDAGFDGVELHGANGYLIHQFISDQSNRRNDEWGGCPQRRIRFAQAVASAVADRIGGERVGFRISPGNLGESELAATYQFLTDALAETGLVYLHLLETPANQELTELIARRWPATFILNPATGQRPTGAAELALLGELADLISFGRSFIANPDLVARLHAGGPYAEPDPATFYTGGVRGYLDYPPMP